MTDKKVLHVITRFLKGGADEKTILSCIGLKESNYDVTLTFGSEYDEEMVSRAKKEGIKTHSFSMLKHFNPFSTFFSIFQIYSFIKKNDFDIVHTHSTEAGIAGRLAAKFAGVPIIIHTNHGLPFGKNRNILLRNFIILCEKLAAIFTTKLVSNADYITEIYLNKGIGKREQYTTIYSGIDLEKIKNAKKANLKSKKKKVLMVSRLAKGKGFYDLIEASKRVLEEEDVIFYIAGDGEERENIERKIKKENVQKNFKLLGFRKDVPSLMKACDVFVLPSHFEGTPRVITEAMACGLPVVATNVGGIPDQIKDGKNGILISPNDTDKLADSILKILGDKKLAKKMGKKGKEISKKFDMNKMTEDINKLYSNLHR